MYKTMYTVHSHTVIIWKRYEDKYQIIKLCYLIDHGSRVLASTNYISKFDTTDTNGTHYQLTV